MPIVSIVIPCWNGAQYLDRCIGSVLAQSRLPEEVLIIDDGSDDGTPELARTKALRLISHKRRRGLGAARNTGIRAAMGDIIVFVDADTAPMPNMLEELLHPYSSPDVCGVGGQGVELGSKNIPDRWRSLFWVQTQGQQFISRAPFLSGLCCSYRKDSIEDIGWFDERYMTNGEDVDIGLRFRRAGYNLVYNPSAKVLHLREDTFISLLRLTARHSYWQCFALSVNGESCWPVWKNSMKWIGISAGSSLIKHRSPMLAAASVLFCLSAIAGLAASAGCLHKVR